MTLRFYPPDDFVFESAAARSDDIGNDPTTDPDSEGEASRVLSLLEAILPPDDFALIREVVIDGRSYAESARKRRVHRGTALRHFQDALRTAQLHLTAAAARVLIDRGHTRFTLDARTGECVRECDALALSESEAECRFDHPPMFPELADYCLRNAQNLLDPYGDTYLNGRLDRDISEWRLGVTRFHDRIQAAVAQRHVRESIIDMLAGAPVSLFRQNHRAA